jgi:hypothetical protein
VAAIASTVWMVHRQTGLEGVRGRLALEPDRLVFTPDSGGDESSFPLVQMGRVHRLLASPVLEVRMAWDRDPPAVGFFFVEPPGDEMIDRPRFTSGRRKARRSAIFQLMGSNAAKKDEIKRWVRLIRERAGR